MTNRGHFCKKVHLRFFQSWKGIHSTKIWDVFDFFSKSLPGKTRVLETWNPSTFQQPTPTCKATLWTLCSCQRLKKKEGARAHGNHQVSKKQTKAAGNLFTPSGPHEIFKTDGFLEIPESYPPFHRRLVYTGFLKANLLAIEFVITPIYNIPYPTYK